jgi:myosin heavy subunit
MPPKKVVPDITKMSFPVWAKPGKAIWVEVMDPQEGEPKEYLQGRIDQIFEDKKIATIIYEEGQGEKEVYANRILERAEEPQVLEDLVDVDPLNDAELLRCLHMRFKNDDVYCYCGPTLLATNPYKRIPKSATDEHLAMFRKYALNGGKIIKMPHIWNLASTSFWQLFQNQRNQAVCISGESGAGKTVGTKLCMAFITSLFPAEDGEKDAVPIEDRILDCNPIMESFGNSKTIRNDNSSRFGKYFIMYVSKKDKHIKGAEIKNYLLEKSRIVVQAETERNYHVFYGILKFMDPAKLKEYGYANSGDKCDMTLFNYLRKSKCFDVPTVNDKEFFDDTNNSFNRLNFEKEEQDAVYKMLALVLNLGNVEIDASTWVDGDRPCSLKDGPYLEKVLKYLEVDKEAFISGIVSKRVITPDQKTLFSPRTPAQAEGIKDAVAKDLFNNVFNWIVRKLNNNLLPRKDDSGNDINLSGLNEEQRTERLKKDYLTVGLLDIFGFEDFMVNSIEQFCINYTNEKLQNLYISYVFKAERVIFEQEGLGEFLAMIKYTDNMPIIQLLDDKPFGIFHLVDSVGKVAQDDGKDDAKLVDMINKNHGKNVYMFWHKMDKTKFGIKHTAKDVYYYSVGFIEKNKDELPLYLLETMDTGNRVIMRIFRNKLTDDEVMEEKVANPMEKFLGYKFRQNMQDLMNELNSCECNFVRCIKPNEAKKADFWVPDLALKQIRYLGVLDSIKVRRDSLPIRKNFQEFYGKYQDLDDISDDRNTPFLKLQSKNPDWKKMSQNAVKSAVKDAKSDDILYGNSRVFMSVYFVNKLEEILEAKQRVKREAVDKIANAFKVFNAADKWERYRKTSVKVVILGKNLFETWNSKVEYIRFKKIIMSIKQMQLNFRQTKYKRHIRELKQSALVIARSYRMFKIREVLFGAKKVINVIGRCVKKIMLRAFMAKLRINKRVTNDVFELAWLQIEEKMKIGASLTVQRIFRGHHDRLKAASEVAKLEIIKAEVKKNRAATTIQKISKGFIVRTRLDRLNRAAGFIQGYTRMLWLSKYFQEMKIASRKIQVKFYKHRKQLENTY